MRRHVLAALLGVALLAGAAHAWPVHQNERIDRALRPGAPSRVVLAGTLHARLAEVEAPDRPQIVPGLQHIVFHVQHVLLGTAYEVGAHLRFSTRTFDWPAPLVPHRKGERVFLIVDPVHKADLIAPFLEHDGRIVTVLPWSGNEPASGSSLEEVERLLARELVSHLARAPDRLRIRALVQTATPVVTAEQAEAAFTPYLEAEDAWLRHAAIAGLAYASPTTGNVERAVEDLRTFIREVPPDATYEDLRSLPGGGTARVRVNAYGMLFNAYAMLRGDGSAAEQQRLHPLLPLHRVVATALTTDPLLRWQWGIEPLCRRGEDVDLPLLYDYYASHTVRSDGRTPHSTAVRTVVVRRLTELLGVPYVLTHTDGGLAGEAEQRALIDEALEKRRAARD